MKFLKFSCLFLVAACRHAEPSALKEAVSSFHPEPLTCDAWHSKEYPCDGYTQMNLPSGPGSANPTAEIATSTAPPSGYIGLQTLFGFDPNKPSVIYIHGWNVEDPSHVFGLPDQWAQQAQAAGFNVLHFHWAALSFDDGKGCPGLQWAGWGNTPCNVVHAYFKRGGAADLFLEAYAQQFAGYRKPVRLVFQSLAGSLGIYATYRMYQRADFAAVRKPNRLDIIDPFIMAGFGADRSVPYNGQIPPDETLPDDYRTRLVRDFVPNSPCQANNALSQYCQTEGMAYHLVRDFNVGIFTLSSIVAGLTARDFRRISAHESFGTFAFGARHLTTRHTAPNAAYFYSFAPGEPRNGFDASTTDETILRVSQEKIKTGAFATRMQTAGFDTITLMDDRFEAQGN